jgi:hypothetical protein
MAPVITAEPELEPWQEFDPGPEPGDRGVDQAGRTYVWFEPHGWQPEEESAAAQREPEMEAG